MNPGSDIQSLKEKIDANNKEAWYTRVNDSQRSLRISEESLGQARNINYAKGTADGLLNVAFCNIRMARNDEAVPLLDEAYAIYDTINDNTGKALVNEYRAIIHRNQGDPAASIELLFQALRLTENTPVDENHATHNYQLGVTYKHLGDFESALDYFYRSLKVCRDIDHPLYEAYSINMIGTIYFETGDYQKALDYFLQGLPMRRAGGDKWGEAGSLDNIGITYLRLQDIDKAIDYCNQSLEITRSTDDKRGEANALFHLAEIYEKAGNKMEALRYSDESLQIRKERGDKRGEAEVLLFLGESYKNRGVTDDHRAFDYLSRALQLAGEIKAQDLLSKINYSIYEYYNAKEKFHESLHHLRSHLQIETELHKNSINQKISHLEISYKAETISKRNKELTELNERIEKANAELRIERSLERVRTAAMAMKEPSDMLEICKIISHELVSLNVQEIRNVQTAVFNDEKGTYMNYEYYARHDKAFITDTSYRDHAVAENFATRMMKGPNEFFFHRFEGTEVRDWLSYQKGTNVFIDNYLESASSLNYYWYSLGRVALGMSTYLPLSEEQIGLFKRFRNVFELAYRRYTDIGKALAQTREALIEATLERIRSRTMGMQRSEELPEAASLLFQQIEALGIPVFSAGYNIWNEDNNSATSWMSSRGIIQQPFRVPLSEDPALIECYAAWQRGDSLFVQELSGDKLLSHMKYMGSLPVIGELMKHMHDTGISLPDFMINHHAFFTQGYLLFITYEAVPDAHEIFKRFARVFEQTYTRFLDLQKAEAQAREAQIETALERIRARAMAMHASDELVEVANILRQQMGLLGQPELETSVVNLYDPETDLIHNWSAFHQPGVSGSIETSIASFPGSSCELTREMVTLYRSGKKEFTLTATGSKLREFFDVLIKSDPKVAGYTGRYMPEQVFYHFSSFTGGALLTVSYQPPSEETRLLQRRASAVFDMAYRRYLDLKKAEAQAREAQIETGLERVRSKTMAMHRSEEVTGIAVSLNEELLKLGFTGGSTIIIIDPETGDTEQWTGFSEDKTIKSCFVPAFKHPYHELLIRTWKKSENFLVYTVTGEEKKSLDKHYFSTGYKIFPESDKKWMREMKSVTFSHAFMKYGAIHWGPDHLTEEQLKILLRFSNVFEQSYTRFLDLQKAEAQAREAQIEAALERVRSRSMAMHKPDELLNAAELLYKELTGLGISSMNVSYAFVDEQEKSGSFYSVNPVDDSIMPLPFVFPHTETAVMRSLLSSWKKQEPFSLIELDEEATRQHQTYIGGHILKLIIDSKIDLPFSVEAFLAKSPKTAAIYSFNFKQGYLFVIGEERLTAMQEDLVLRFTNVFAMTYRRFLDLQKAEAQAREAQIEAALERVRSRSMAMQKSEELKDVIRVVYEQFVHLNIPVEHAGFIMDYKEREDMHIWLADQQHVPSEVIIPYFNSPHWNSFIEAKNTSKNFFVNHLSFEEKNKFYTDLFRLFPVPDEAKKYYFGCPGLAISTVLMDNVGLYIENFSGTTFSEEENTILMRFGKVFQQTYTRFHDLKKAEAQAEQARLDLIQIQHEKKRAEEALAELQSTQKQLIQTEKMASLGELTAGIAHEIQNPLNFVNNFSDVSSELIEEMKNELVTGNTRSALEIADDVKDNLEKILHHGKRADAIVKGMLQHSRSSSGVKEPTDLNSLADEYLRLAFHGFRAKDKSFNAKFETDFDHSIERLKVIPQDIGRVILNLINNAFYTVNEKKKLAGNGYEPKVILSTRKNNDKVEISVKDNGNGIPQKVLDKIFQPFFTTKPTGQGTGLGLSLSYDIITKGHAGEINVKTKEGSGAEFIISLPVN